ncbi:rod shape-determining protein RodA, partial [bacterium]|nr:rod shape-determining protein RodA [bacterium]
MRKKTFIISDRPLFSILICLLTISALLLYSATYRMAGSAYASDFFVKQMIWMGVGFLVMFFTANFNYKKLGSYAYFLYGINMFLLLCVLFFGRKILGATRWISIAGFTFQPSETMKIVIIITLAWYLHRTKEQKWGINKFLASFLFVVFPMLLILKQPDLGTTLVFVPIYLSMVFVAGMPLRYIFGLIFAGILSSPIAWMFLKEYQKRRIFVFLNPYDDQFGSGWPIIQSKIAIGSGKLFGKGFMKGTQTQLDFLPEHHTDFIFSVLG